MEIIVEVNPSDEQRAWEQFRAASTMQRVLHNECVANIRRTHRKLETVMSSELQDAQAAIRAYRQILSVIHGKDSSETKKFYESTSESAS